jgi:hypothetical protein
LPKISEGFPAELIPENLATFLENTHKLLFYNINIRHSPPDRPAGQGGKTRAFVSKTRPGAVIHRSSELRMSATKNQG